MSAALFAARATDKTGVSDDEDKEAIAEQEHVVFVDCCRDIKVQRVEEREER